ncbi:MAG: hypothetical protein QM754_05585 [Tepidisphaeraceae bacterium]
MLRKVGLLLIAGLLILPFTSAATRPTNDDQDRPTVRPADASAILASVPMISISGMGHSELIGGFLTASVALWYMRSRMA